MRHRHLVLSFALSTALLAATCGKRIAVPLLPCVVQGTTLTQVTAAQAGGDPTAVVDKEVWYSRRGNPTIAKTVDDLISGGNDNTWVPDADIAFFHPVDTVGRGFLPVIPDPMPPGNGVGVGRLGDISIEGNAGELEDAVEACRSSWAVMGVPGTPVLLVRRFVNGDGAPVGHVGASPGPLKLLTTASGIAGLCNAPRQLSTLDLEGQYAAIKEPASFPLGTSQYAWVYLAHELGHTLLLSHGDGLDNDGNGAIVGADGPRLYDLGCDSQEYRNFEEAPGAIPGSLMQAIGSVSHLITPLQRESARDAAVKMPGVIGTTP